KAPLGPQEDQELLDCHREAITHHRHPPELLSAREGGRCRPACDGRRWLSAVGWRLRNGGSPCRGRRPARARSASARLPSPSWRRPAPAEGEYALLPPLRHVRRAVRRPAPPRLPPPCA